MATPPPEPTRRGASAGRPRGAPCAADSFHLEIGGISTASFTSCSGLESSVAVFEYVEGGANAPRKLRGAESFSNIVLERGVARDRELFDWYSRGDRRDGAVVLLDPAGREVVRWALTRAWPCRWTGPTLDASAAEVAIESVEIAHEGLRCIDR
jgi:phage tail-like protein